MDEHGRGLFMGYEGDWPERTGVKLLHIDIDGRQQRVIVRRNVKVVELDGSDLQVEELANATGASLRSSHTNEEDVPKHPASMNLHGGDVKYDRSSQKEDEDTILKVMKESNEIKEIGERKSNRRKKKIEKYTDETNVKNKTNEYVVESIDEGPRQRISKTTQQSEDHYLVKWKGFKKRSHGSLKEI